MKKVRVIFFDIFVVFNIWLLSQWSPYEEELMLDVNPISGDKVEVLSFLWKVIVIGVFLIILYKWRNRKVLYKRTRYLYHIFYIVLLIFCILKTISVDELVGRLKDSTSTPTYICQIDSNSRAADFRAYESEFNLIKDMVLTVQKDDAELDTYYMECDSLGNIIGLKDFPKTLSKDELEALNKLSNSFKGDFYSIKYSLERIDFDGGEAEKFVYMIEDEIPDGFLSSNTDSDFFCEKIEKNWYYLHWISY